MTEIDSFEALLQAAREQPQPQRLLFVFVQTVLPKDADAAQAQRFEAGHGGGLTPVMYVDKHEDELTDFAGLVEESRQMTETWDIVLIGCMSGSSGLAPTPEAADEPIKTMVRTIHTGGNLGQFASFDRQGCPVLFE
jgi:hypothetical protein